VLTDLKLTVRAVLSDEAFGSDFTLNPSPAPPRNAFVPLHLLQKEIDQPGRANALLVSGGSTELQKALHERLTLDDWGLVLQSPESRTRALFDKLDRNKDGKLSRNEWRNRIAGPLAQRADPKTGELTEEAVRTYYRQRGYLSLESRQMLVDGATADAALKAAQQCGLRAAPTLVYLADWIKEQGHSVPYSVVAALDQSLPPPLGPFIPGSDRPLRDDEIVLAEWEARPVAPLIGAAIALTYLHPEQEGKLAEREAKFKLRATVPLQGPTDDPDLTPEFPGITDKLALAEWNPPFPYDNKRVKKSDEEYWDRHRTTPKAYVTLAAGQRLWGSRFGKLTSIRLAPTDGSDLEKSAESFRKQLLQELRPEEGGFVFDAVRQRGLDASAKGNDFTLLFLGFSFFLIAAALLLVGLLFRLNLERRSSEVGLLMALGYRRRTLRWLLLAEGGILAVIGGIIGSAGALAYAWGLLEFLRTWWPASLDRSFLRLHVTAQSLLVGYFLSLAVGMLTIAWAVRVLGKVAPRALLAGETEDSSPTATARKPRWSVATAWLTGLGGLAAIFLGTTVRDHEAQAGAFFTGGFLLLTAGLAVLWAFLRRSEARPATLAPHLRMASLATRNAARHPVRSLLTAGLLAAAAFLIVAVESFRREPARDFLRPDGGSGGFAFLGEADVPLFQDLNKGPGREELGEALQRQRQPASALDAVSFFPFRLRGGDDASCLNLYQPRRPRLLGVPRSLIERGGFQFAEVEEKSANPWNSLQTHRTDDAIPVFGEKNTVEWMLKSKLGGVIEVPNERGDKVNLRIVGLLQDSVFQSELLMSEENFLRLYPGQQGYNFFLIDTPPERAASLKPILETALADSGFEVTPTAQRLAAYLAVENTYLSTFQALGGLGLVLGALGLAVVLLRSVWERRGEMALLRALGFRRRVLGWLVLLENGFLLIVGLGVGAVAALVSVAPHLFTVAGSVPGARLAGLLALVFVVGLGAGAAAMAATVRAPLLPALRRE
jgi:ABC-type antimicrobial peptide transport system permease subunit